MVDLIHQYGSTAIIILSSTIFIVLFVVLVKRKSILGGKSRDGSEIRRSKYKKYKSIKDIPKIKENIGNGKVIAYFNHKDCSGCKVLSPEFDKLSMNNKYSNHTFVSINPTSDNIDFLSVGIMFVPTILIFDQDGDLEKNIIGLMKGSAELVIEEIKSLINN